MNINSLFKRNETQLFELQRSFIKYLIYYLILFFIPIVIPAILTNIPYVNYINKYNQIIIGVIVNMTLIRMAITSKHYAPLIIGCALPSLSALPFGLVGTITLPFMYSCFMMPFIWLGNLSLVLIFKILFSKRQINYALVSTIALIVKVTIIYGFFCIISYASGIIPVDYLGFGNMQLAMSLYQVITLITAESLNIYFAIKFKKMNNYERL